MTEPIDLSEVARDAEELDALAAGRPTSDPAVVLLGALRDRAPAPVVPGPEPVTLPAPRRRAFAVTRRRAAVVLAVAAIVPSTGVAAAAAHPGNPFYGIHRAILGPTSDDSSVPRTLLDKADHEASAAVTADTSRAAQHVAAGWVLVTKARAHLPDLHADDAAELSDRAARIESRLRATGLHRTATAGLVVPAVRTAAHAGRRHHNHHHHERAALLVVAVRAVNDARRP